MRILNSYFRQIRFVVIFTCISYVYITCLKRELFEFSLKVFVLF